MTSTTKPMALTTKPDNAIIDYLANQHVLSLCTLDSEGLWCASCFYLFEAESMSFYLMTDDKSRHAQAMEQKPEIAGTICDQTESVAHIQGVQYKAIASRVSAERQAKIKALYCKRFPVARLKFAPLWQLQLTQIKMVNNRLGFGKKLEWLRGIN